MIIQIEGIESIPINHNQNPEKKERHLEFDKSATTLRP